MAICSRCGDEFDVSSARRKIGRKYGSGTYDEYYPDEDVCASCAESEISCDYATGEELKELMGTASWEDD